MENSYDTFIVFIIFFELVTQINFVSYRRKSVKQVWSKWWQKCFF